ncbi:MAG: BatD family protein [Bacteroidetes bacterium]|nr:BatD family protein [Bacteroidota bacterium]
MNINRFSHSIIRLMARVLPVLAVAVLSGGRQAEAQSLTVQISCDQTTWRINDLIPVTIEVSAGSNLNLPKAELKLPQGIKRIPGQSSTGQSISIVNGSYRITVSENLALSTTKAGSYSIGPAVVTLNGKTFSSNTLTLKVLEAGEKAPSGSQAASVDDIVFLKAFPSTTVPVTGQPVYIRYKLYFRTRVSNLNLVTDAGGTGILSEDLNSGRPNQQPDQELINGVSYSVVTIREILVYPQQTGPVTITPLVLNLQVARPRKTSRQSIFDDFLADPFQDYAQINVTSPKVVLSVKNPGQAPSDFSGFTGRLVATRKVDRKSVAVNQPVSVVMTFEGAGNFKNFIPPKLDFPPPAESYPPKETVRINPTANGGAGTWTVEYTVIPRVTGELEIPAAGFSYFDLASGKYTQVEFPSESVKVTGDPNSGGAGTGESYDFRAIGRDISFIMTETNLTETGSRLNLLALGTGTVLVIWGGLGLVFWFRRRQLKERADILGYGHKNAIRFAKKSLAQVRKIQAEGGDMKAVLSELHRVFSQFIARRTRLEESAWTVDEVLAELNRQQVPSEVLEAVTSFLTRLNEYRFAPVQMISESADDLIENGEKILTELAKYL